MLAKAKDKQHPGHRCLKGCQGIQSNPLKRWPLDQPKRPNSTTGLASGALRYLQEIVSTWTTNRLFIVEFTGTGCWPTQMCSRLWGHGCVVFFLKSKIQVPFMMKPRMGRNFHLRLKEIWQQILQQICQQLASKQVMKFDHSANLCISMSHICRIPSMTLLLHHPCCTASSWHADNICFTLPVQVWRFKQKGFL